MYTYIETDLIEKVTYSNIVLVRMTTERRKKMWIEMHYHNGKRIDIGIKKQPYSVR